ncbi:MULTISPECIES: TonB-dependent receptor [Asticcacaulis]|uniref:TonB-dependent receptor n=1 Tax=Asticcacaulis TaxID=76890 RepID=UPI001AE723D1|nr:MULTISPECIES: TonB-dependent receptor [Asticcacaulis]MBP2161629.1 TonB-dependent receptor [Asticcacaulis solisilvae]MDR6802674.1 TonB-dependent receptor [Asticcacaulis sp. BE141]
MSVKKPGHRSGHAMRLGLTAAASVLAITFAAPAAFAQDPAPAAAPADDEIVVVKGVRASMAKAVNVKRRSTQIVDSVIAEDIGKLPDNNVVEALQRVPGVQVTNRANGEVSGISIRGMPDVTTTWNGRFVFTGTGRQLALQDIPSNLVNRIDVFKTRTADQIETGIAGQIDVSTHRPFNFKGPQISVAARGIYHEQRGEFNPNVSALLSNRWDTGAGEVGALVNLSYAATKYRNQDLNVGASVPFLTENPPPGFVKLERLFPDNPRSPWPTGLETGLPYAPGSTLKVDGVDRPYYLSRDAMIATDLQGDRERPAVNMAFQWRPSQNAEYTAEYFYEGYRNKIFNSMLFTFVDWWGSLGPNPTFTLIPDTNIIKSRAVNDVYGFNSSDYTQQSTDTHVFALNGKWTFDNNLVLVGDLSYQTSEFTSNFFAMRTERAGHDVVIDFNADEGLPAYHFTDPNVLTDPTAWGIAQLYDNSDRQKGDALTVSLDGDWASDDGIVRKFSFGFRYDDRGAESYFRGQDAPVLGRPLSSLPAEAMFYNENFFDGRADVPQSWVLPNGHWLYEHADDIRTQYKTVKPTFQTSDQFVMNKDFDVQEATTSAYVMWDLEPELFGRPLLANIGVRYVSVTTDMAFQDRLTGNIGTESAEVSRLLPNVTLRYDITNDIRVRYNYGETLRRPNFGDLNPNFTLTGDLSNIGRGSGSRGNPYLKPTESKNQDIAFEWYFARDSVVHLTLFSREIEGLVITSPNIFTITNSGLNTSTFLINQPVNASNGKLTGAELGLTYFPDNLPGILQGFGVQASATWLDSSQNIPLYDTSGVTPVLLGEDQSSFFGVSDFSYNATLAYDRGPVGARLSYVWRDDFLAFNEARLFANPLGVWAKPEKSVDFQINYDINDRLSISFDAVNLTDEIGQNYYKFADAGGPDLFNHVSTLWSRQFAVGLRWRFN